MPSDFLSSWLRRAVPSFRGRRQRSRPHQAGCRPRLEVLEDRRLLTTITDLGVFSVFSPTALNGAGQVVGYAPFSNHAVLYSGGQMTELGTLPGGTRSYAYGINDAGQVVGNSDIAGGTGHAFLWQNGTMTDLGTLGGLGSAASGINAAGQVTGIAAARNGYGHPFRTAPGQPIDPATDDLEPPSATESSDGQGINDAGQVAGYSRNSSGQTRAVLYSGGGKIELGALPGDSESVAVGINNAGEVAGNSGANSTLTHAFLYRGGLVNLGTLGGIVSQAHGMNNAGQVVGWSTTTGSSSDYLHPFLYNQGRMTDLNDLLPAGSGWELVNAIAINDRGQILGYGTHDGQGGHGFLLDSLTEIAPTSLAWNATQSGVDYTWTVSGLPVPRDTSVALYWASGDRFEDRLGGPIDGAGQTVAAGTTPGTYGPFSVPGSLLQNPPPGATHLLLVTDPGHVLGPDPGVRALALFDAVNVEEINFDGPSNVPIRIDESTAIGDPTGTRSEDIEWERGLRDRPNSQQAWDTTQSAPAAFVQGNALQLEVRFSVDDPLITSITVGADNRGPYGDLPDTVIPISDGVGTATFVTSGPAVGTVDVNDITFQWRLRSVTVGGQVIARDDSLGETTHRIYTLAAIPVAPMDTPWATVLELAAGIARGTSTDDHLVEQETRGIHYSWWRNFADRVHFLDPRAILVYEPHGARTDAVGMHPFEAQVYDLTNFLSFLSEPEVIQQCDDNANLLSLFCRSLGVDLTPLWLAHVDPSAWTGQAGDAMVPDTYYPAGREAPVIRDTFRFHQVGLWNGRVYDPSTRPEATGDPYLGLSLEDYLDAALPGQRAAGFVTQDVTSLTVGTVPHTTFVFDTIDPGPGPPGATTRVTLDGAGFDPTLFLDAVEPGTTTPAAGVTILPVSLVSGNEVVFDVIVDPDAVGRPIELLGFKFGTSGGRRIGFTIDAGQRPGGSPPPGGHGPGSVRGFDPAALPALPIGLLPPESWGQPGGPARFPGAPAAAPPSAVASRADGTGQDADEPPAAVGPRSANALGKSSESPTAGRKGALARRSVGRAAESRVADSGRLDPGARAVAPSDEAVIRTISPG